jgi:hypothetical protein
MDFTQLVKKYTWNKSDDERAEAWLAVVERLQHMIKTKC